VCIAAAAAKINAQLQAKKGIQHVDVPPIISVRSASTQPSTILSNAFIRVEAPPQKQVPPPMVLQSSTTTSTSPTGITSKISM
jgi:hypothetical protein